ncbi:MAG: four-carbon acid sugar kinase family protein [Halobacteriales archaeon]
MDYEGLVVADDLTGAADTGSRFAARGYRTAVALEGRPDADVLVRDTDSRHLDPGPAADRVREAVAGVDAGVVYKKVDSTLRGNLGAEVDAAMAAAGADLAVVAPAFPANGRTTVGGIHLVDGTPVARTEAGTDPAAPVPTSRIGALLAGAERPITRVGIGTVAAGAGAVADALADAPEGALAVCDAARGDHLAAVAGGADDAEAEVLYVGSAGLAGHVRRGEGVLGVAGSTAPETLAALAALPEEQVVALDGEGIVAGTAAGVDRAVAALDATGRAVVTAARSAEDVEATLEAGREAGLDPAETRDRVARALAGAVAGAYGRRPVGGLFATGGATAAATLAALGGDGLAPTGHEVAAGVPIGRVRGGDADGIPVVTKAGAFGGRETILTCLDRLAGYHD